MKIKEWLRAKTEPNWKILLAIILQFLFGFVVGWIFARVN